MQLSSQEIKAYQCKEQPLVLVYLEVLTSTRRCFNQLLWTKLANSQMYFNKMLRFTLPVRVVPFGLVVRIPGFHRWPRFHSRNGNNFIFLIIFFSFSLQLKHIFS